MKPQKRLHSVDTYGSRIVKLAMLLLIIFAVFTVANAYLYSITEQNVLAEKVLEYERHLDILSERTDFNAELPLDGGQYRKDRLIHTMELLDSTPDVFASAYSVNGEELIEISNRIGTYGTPFDPRTDPVFVKAVLDDFDDRSQTFTIPITYTHAETESAPNRTVWVSYRWVPTDYENTESFLIAAGVSTFSIANAIPPTMYLIYIGQLLVLIVIVGLLIRWANKIRIAGNRLEIEQECSKILQGMTKK